MPDESCRKCGNNLSPIRNVRIMRFFYKAYVWHVVQKYVILKF